MKYYLVSYSHSRGYGNVFLASTKYLDIRQAEKSIAKDIGGDGVVIITINPITKAQFVDKE